MTLLEDKVRAAIRAKAERVPPEAVPALRLPSRRRFPSPAYRGGGMTGMARRFRWLAPAAAAAAAAAVIVVAVTLPHAVPDRAAAPAVAAAQGRTAQAEAAHWVAAQIGRTAVVSCDPAMCRTLRAHGVHAADLLRLRSTAVNPVASEVIVATAAVRREFGRRLEDVYAPAVIASFGSGPARVEIRAIAVAGAAAYGRELGADLRARKLAGTQLADSDRLTIPAAPRSQLRAGQIDPRLMIILAAMAARQLLSIVRFADAGPGASAGVPLRSVTLAAAGSSRHDRSAELRSMRTFLGSLRAPFKPASIGTVRPSRGRAQLRVAFAAPSPLGLLRSGT